MRWRDALARAGRLMVGVPDYATYVAHRRSAHLGEPVMSEAEFLRERGERRLGGGGVGRCC